MNSRIFYHKQHQLKKNHVNSSLLQAIDFFLPSCFAARAARFAHGHIVFNHEFFYSAGAERC